MSLEYSFSEMRTPLATILFVSPDRSQVTGLRVCSENLYYCATDWISESADILMRLTVRRYSMLLIDLNTRDGVKIVQMIRREEKSRVPMPIVGLNGSFLSDQQVQQYKDAGMQEIIFHPLTERDVKKILLTHVFKCVSVS